MDITLCKLKTSEGTAKREWKEKQECLLKSQLIHPVVEEIHTVAWYPTGAEKKETNSSDSTKELLWPESLSFQGKGAFQLKCLLIIRVPCPRGLWDFFFERTTVQ